MNPARRRLEGFFEHASGWRASWRAALRTLLWTAWPPRFWKRVRLHHEPRVKMLAWLPVWMGSIWLLVAGVRLIELMIHASLGRVRGPWWISESVNAFVRPVVSIYPMGRRPGTLGAWGVHWEFLGWIPAILGLLGQAVFFPLLLLLLPEMRLRAKVRKAHVIRAAIYGQAWLVLLLLWNLAIALDDARGAVHLTGGLWYDLADVIYLSLIALTAAWVSLWWWCVLSRGFGIARPGFHWCVLMIPSALVLLIGLAMDDYVIQLISF
jgi:hypothetical protein